VADLTPEEWLLHLTRCHNNELPSLNALNDYYEGQQQLSYMHPLLLAELGDRLRSVVINWPRLVTDSIEERLDVEGFRLPDAEDADEDIQRVWQANDLDEWSQQAHVDAMVMRRAFAVVGTNEDDADTPLVTVESPLQMFAEMDSRTRKPRAAVKRWSDRWPGRDAAQWADNAMLYLPDARIWYQRTGSAGWQVVDRDDHRLGELQVVPLVNRGRLLIPMGVSELADVIPLSDAANKIATDMMVSAEFHAMPRRYALGFDEDDFVDEDGNKLNTWQTIAGRVWRTEKSPKDDGVAVGQFAEADLRNFHETLNQLARIAGSLAALPAQYLGFTTDNPASADAIRSNEARLVKRAERKQRAFGGSWERVARLVNRFQTGEWDPRFRQLETLWRDAATPTYAQKADGVVKLHTDGILPTEAAWEDLGYSPQRILRLKEMRDAERTDPVLQAAIRDVAPANPSQAAVPPAQ
jgi:hypothetical protein